MSHLSAAKYWLLGLALLIALVVVVNPVALLSPAEPVQPVAQQATATATRTVRPTQLLPTITPTTTRPPPVTALQPAERNAQAVRVGQPVDPYATPTPRPSGTPPRVGLQAGHWQTENMPDELARFRTATGANAGGYSEAEVNLDIANRTAELLRAKGIEVDVLPAFVPPRYDADVFVALHADGSSDTWRRGFKVATPWRSSPASEMLGAALTESYGRGTALPWDDTITRNMRGYYAFNFGRYQHAISRTTPAVILELGYLTNDEDRAFLTQQPDVSAAAIASGIERYLAERDPNDGGALIPVELTHRIVDEEQAIDIHRLPDPGSEIGLVAETGALVVPFDEHGVWYNVFARNEDGEGFVGWALKEAVDGRTYQIEVSPRPTPTPDGT